MGVGGREKKEIRKEGGRRGKSLVRKYGKTTEDGKNGKRRNEEVGKIE